MFDSYNMTETVRPEVDTEQMDFVKLDQFCGGTVKVDGFFFTEGDYGKQVVVVGEGYKINMPGRCVKDFESIMKKPHELAAVLSGHLVLTDIRPKSTKNGDTVIFRYTEV